MMKENFIRPIAVVIIKNNGRVLATPGFDKNKQENFCRLPGGGIEFCETSLEALEREIKEEFDTTLKNIKFLQVIENIFNYQGKNGHEICFIYEAEFANEEMYQKEELPILDSLDKTVAVWVDVTEMERIYPQGVAKLI